MEMSCSLLFLIFTKRSENAYFCVFKEEEKDRQENEALRVKKEAEEKAFLEAQTKQVKIGTQYVHVMVTLEKLLVNYVKRSYFGYQKLSTNCGAWH